ncbi:hypothetical protein [Oryzobacter terrae]|uniref:hypothetical protein n=1 Tax=Oryzobacter terrae TaxID=1620385 RepID=UPI00366E5667
METRETLDRAVAEDAEATTLRAKLRALRAQAATERSSLEAVRGRHRREEEDVDRLDGLGLTSLTSLLRGSRSADLRRERAEEEAARADLKSALARLQTVETQAEEVDRRLARLGDTATTREAAADAHARALVAVGGLEGAAVAAVLTELDEADAAVRELTRVRDAGARAATALDGARRELERAGSWSTFDAFGGGELIGSAAKHQRMEGAGRFIVDAQDAFFDFASAVRDPGPVTRLRPDLGVGSVRSGLDIWLDDPVSDRTVHRSIARTAEQVEAAATFVRDALARTLQEQAALEARCLELRERRDALLSPRG